MDSLDISGDHHICIRCKQTIAGLDAYVNHRKSGNCEPISAHKFFNCLQLQCKYKDICGDNEEEVDDEEDGEDERSVRSDATDPNQSYDNSDDEVSDEDIYRPPNDFTGGKWKPGSHPQSSHRSVAAGITSYVTDDSSDGSEFCGHKRRASDQSMKSAEECDELVVGDRCPAPVSGLHSRCGGKRAIDLNECHVTGDETVFDGNQCLKEVIICDNSVVDSTESQLMCKLCVYKAVDSFDLLKHYLCSTNHSAVDDVLGVASIAENESHLMRRLSFVCQICSFYTNQSNTYLWHLTTSQHRLSANSRTTRYECRVCRQTCADVETLMAHMDANRVIHANSSGPVIVCEVHKMVPNSDNAANCATNRFKCDFCGQVFSFKTHLKRHTLSEHVRRVAFPDLIKSNFIGDNPGYCCPTCDFKTDRQSTHLLHSVNHEMPVPSDDKPALQSANDLKAKRHIRRSEDKYRCPVCRKAYICRELRLHINGHLNETPYECIQCDKKFSKLVYLRNHEKTHSTVKDKSCATCGARFASNKLLRNHAKTHDSSRERTVRCDVCGAEFYSKFVLRAHLLRHTPAADRPFKCEAPGCRRAFVNRRELSEHSMVHSAPGDDSQKVLLCDQCVYKTRSVSALRRHYRQHTGDKPFKCKFCDFKAHLSSNLSRHMRVHTGAKPYSCPYCSYVCNTQENVRKHILKTRKHNGLFVYPCAHCDHKTNLFTEFRHHLRERHSDLYNDQQIDAFVSHLFRNTNC